MAKCRSLAFDTQCVPLPVGLFEVRGQCHLGGVDGDGGLPPSSGSSG
jgi:hypothetical protein